MLCLDIYICVISECYKEHDQAAEDYTRQINRTNMIDRGAQKSATTLQTSRTSITLRRTESVALRDGMKSV